MRHSSAYFAPDSSLHQSPQVYGAIAYYLDNEKYATTKVRTTSCSSPPPLRLSPVGAVASAVENV
jgi:hypothetical protein